MLEQQENEYLRSCLKAKGLNSKQCVPADKRDASIPAKVITNSLYERNNIITLDKGYKDGVRENMGVVDGNGVVGVVYLVSDHYCTVLSLLNHSYWVVGLTVGAIVVCVLGHLIDPETIRRYTNGMEFSMAALFIVIFTDQMREFLKHG